MKTETQEKFDEIIRTCFHQKMKPLGFKKRANNFYRNVGEVGHIINVQKSMFKSKNEISFTVNIGIFSPEYWESVFNFQEKPEPPNFPTEPESIIRLRIGDFINGSDKWYDLNWLTNHAKIIEELEQVLDDKILPFFERVKSNHELIDYLESEYIASNSNYLKFVMYGELGIKNKLRGIYPILIEECTKYQINHIKEKAIKYGIENEHR